MPKNNSKSRREQRRAGAVQRSPLADWVFSDHAHETMLRRGYCIREVIDALVQPDVTYPVGLHYPNAERRRIYQHGRIGLVVDFVDRGIISVQHRNEDDYAITA